MAAIHPTESPPRKQTPSRTNSTTRLVHDAVHTTKHTTKFGGTHIARLLLMLPFVLSAFMPALQRLYILHPPTFSSPVSLFDTGIGTDLHALTCLMGILTLVWSQMLEARRRQKPRHEVLISQKADGMTAEQAGDAGYTATQMEQAGYDKVDIGATLTGRKMGGMTAPEASAAGYTPAQMQQAGYTPDDIGGGLADQKSGGMTDSQASAAGFTPAQREAAGYTPAPASDQKQTSRWRSMLGGSTAKDARSIKGWSRFDCIEAACVCVTGAVGLLLTKSDLTLAYRLAFAIACLPICVVIIVIIKRMVHAVVYTQGNSFPSWVTSTATPVLSKALLLEIVLLIMWVHASMYAPYPKPQLEWALSVMLGTGNNSEILCDNEAAFWSSFSLPFAWGAYQEPLECDEPTCGYTAWRDLCQARRLAPLADHTKRIVWYLFWTVPILLLLMINLVGNGRIARGSQGDLNLKGLLAPHILLTLGLGFCALSVGIYYAATFLVHVPQLMSGQAPSDPRVCLHASTCAQLFNALYLGVAAFALLPIDTLGRFLKQRRHSSRSYFLSYKQNDQNDGAVQMLYSLLPKGSSWLDKHAKDRSKTGMVDGVTNCDVFVAVLSPKYLSSPFCCLEMHTALSEGKPILVVFNQSKFRVQDALGWIPPELGMLKSNELLPIQEDIQMATTCVARIEAADIKPLNAAHSVPNLPKNSTCGWTTADELQFLTNEEILGIRALLAGQQFSFGSQEEPGPYAA